MAFEPSPCLAVVANLSGCRLEAGWRQAGCRLEAGWRQAGGRLEAGWRQAGGSKTEI